MVNTRTWAMTEEDPTYAQKMDYVEAHKHKLKIHLDAKFEKKNLIEGLFIVRYNIGTLSRYIFRRGKLLTPCSGAELVYNCRGRIL